MAQENTAKEKKTEKPAAKPEEPKPQKNPTDTHDPKVLVKDASPATTAESPKPARRPEARPADVKPSPQPAAASVSQAPQHVQERPAETAKQEKTNCWVNMKLFNRWDISGVTVRDDGLAGYIKLSCMTVPRSGGKYGASEQWSKNKMSVVERFMNRLQNTGHRGKKHKISSGNHAGKIQMLYREMKEAFIIIEKRTNKNPVQVLVEAIENSGPLEEVASYRMGGIIARNSVITSPQRRLDLALRHLTQGIYRTSFRNRKALSKVIAEELIAASMGDSKSFAVSEKNRLEKEAEGAR